MFTDLYQFVVFVFVHGNTLMFTDLYHFVVFVFAIIANLIMILNMNMCQKINVGD